MTTPDALALAPMLLLLAWAVAVDLRARRIPNWLTAALVATGLAQSALAASWVTPAQAWAGLAVGVGLTFAQFALGAMGAGDVKLFAGIGAWVGPGNVVAIFAVAAVAGMVIVVCQAVRGGRLTALCRNSAVIVVNAAHGDLSCPPEPVEATPGNRRLPYAVPTLIAVVLVLLSQQRWS
jgi:prepilin peptidase CpaA